MIMADFCSKCGTPLTPDMQFCPKCGEPVNAGAAEQAAPQPEVTETPAQPAPESAPVQQAPEAAKPQITYNTDRGSIKQNAKKQFSAHYWPCVGAIFVSGLLIYGTGFIPLVVAVCFLISLPMMVGRARFCLKAYRGEKPDLGTIFDGFKHYGHNLGGMLWMYLFIFLWSLLFLIPGIIKGLAYYFTPYLLEDYPTLPAQEALKVSMKLTNGHKWEIFVMGLSFIGWGILCALTAGILAVFYVGPYFNISLAGLYEENKNAALANGVVTESQLKGEAPLA
jgi:uncharacterized membrane protein